MKITARDGKELDVDLTLEMIREAIDTWTKDYDSPQNPVRGISLALEAALMKLKEVEDALIRALPDPERPT